MALRHIATMIASFASSPPTATVTLYSCPVVVLPCPGPPSTFTAPTLAGAISAAAAGVATFPPSALHVTLILELPSGGRVGEYGTVAGYPMETSGSVIAAFPTPPPGSTITASVLTANQAEAIGIMAQQISALPGPWVNGPPVTLLDARKGFITLSSRSTTPATVSYTVNGMKTVYTDALFFPTGFADIPGLPAYLSPPPAGITSITDLLTQQGFRDLVLAAGGPDMFAAPGFVDNVINLLDPYMPDPLVMGVANVVGDVLRVRLAYLAAIKQPDAIVLAGDMAEIGSGHFMVALRARLTLGAGLPAPIGLAYPSGTRTLLNMLWAGYELEMAPYRP